MTKFDFFLYDRVVVVGRDPELADYSNPRGEILRVVYSVIAEDDGGSRFEHFFRSQDRDLVVKLLRKIEGAAFAGKLKKLDPRYWHEVDPCYGSKAYIANEHEIVERERADALDAEAWG